MAETEGWQRACRWCGSIIPAAANRQKLYCGNRCKCARYYALTVKARAKQRTCAYCGTSIPAAAHGRRLFCSDGHKSAFHNHRIGQARAAKRAGLHCAFCDIPIAAARGNQLYCSQKCCSRAAQARTSARQEAEQ